MSSEKQWTGKTKGGKVGYGFFISILKTFGLRTAYAILYPVVFFYFIFEKKSRATAYEFIKQVDPNVKGFRLFTFPFRQMFVFGKVLIDRTYYFGTNQQAPYQSTKRNLIKEVLAENKGALVISGHYGGWELASRMIATAYNVPLNVIMYDGEHEKMKEYLKKVQGTNSNLKIISSKDSFGVYIQIYKALKAGEIVVMHGDRRLSNNIIELPFLGKKAEFPEDPFLLAASLDTPLFFSFVTRQKDDTYIFDSKCIKNNKAPSRKKREKAKELCAEYIQFYEETIRNNPSQWFNFYPFWKVNR